VSGGRESSPKLAIFEQHRNAFSGGRSDLMLMFSLVSLGFIYNLSFFAARNFSVVFLLSLYCDN
jgi:hypothetical protein